ncbi:MAG TPA: TetR family transcriptional regulator [Micromonosporaceae bacterium]
MSSTAADATRPLRRDARRNRDLLLTAARTVFASRGLDAPLEEVARQAAVSIGTLYRRFPTREDLIDALFADRLAAACDAARQAADMPDSWAALVHYLTRVGELQADDLGFNDLVGMSLPRAQAAEASKRRSAELVARLLRRAQDDGVVRPDVEPEDLTLLIWGTAQVIRATRDIAPDTWRRYQALMLDALRPGAAHDLPCPALTPDQAQQAMIALGRPRCSRS